MHYDSKKPRRIQAINRSRRGYLVYPTKFHRKESEAQKLRKKQHSDRVSRDFSTGFPGILSMLYAQHVLPVADMLKVRVRDFL